MAHDLIIGSVHLDIVGDVAKSTDKIDKIGSLHISVGGAAFNVAANLAYHDRDVELLSGIRTESFGDLHIQRELKRRKIKRSYLFRSPHLAESGFVAHICAGSLLSAVSSMAVEKMPLDSGKLEKAVAKSSAVAIDANLLQWQIRQIATLCHSEKKPLYGCCVSESKACRMHNLFVGEPAHFFVMFMDRREAAQCGFDDARLKSEPSSDLARSICSEFSAQCVVVRDSMNGYMVFDCRKPDAPLTVKFDGAQSTDVKSDLGAGDALFASIIAAGRSIDWVSHHQTVDEFLNPVLCETEAAPRVETRNSGIDLDEILGGDLVSVLLFLVAGALAFGGMFGFVESPKAVAAAFFGTAVLSGIAGASIAGRLELDDQRDGPRDAGFGAVTGLVAALLLAIPSLVGNSTDYGLLKRLLLSALIVSLVAGMSCRSYLKRLVQNNRPPDTLTGSGREEHVSVPNRRKRVAP
jgi:sugar/nucleoside kinase (ribokinase family)